MDISLSKTPCLFPPAALCRLDDQLRSALLSPAGCRRLAVSAALTLIVGSSLYGAAFGIWRAGLQATYSAVKMPLLLLCVVLASGAINTMLAQVLGTGLTTTQVWTCILLTMAIAAAMLGALSPVAAYLSLQTGGRAGDGGLLRYRVLLLAHTAVIGICGIKANLCLHRLLVFLTGSRKLATRTLCAWIFTSGLVGCELSWVLSPFLARPDILIPLINPNAFNGNFFEYCWRALCGTFG